LITTVSEIDISPLPKQRKIKFESEVEYFIKKAQLIAPLINTSVIKFPFYFMLFTFDVSRLAFHVYTS